MEAEVWRLLAPGLTIAIGGMVPSFAIGWLASRAMNALGRNPEASGAITTSMILSIAFCEAIAIYALVVALILKFV